MSSEYSVITRSVAQHFLENLRKSLDMDALANLVQLDIDQLEQQVDMSIAEAMQTLSLLHGFPYRPGSRALEVGAGFGFASLALASFGYQVTALEPGGIGFNQNRTIAAHVLSVSGLHVEYLDATVEEVVFSEPQSFDLIFSNNVMEHIDDVEIGLQNLTTALGAYGIMVHSCPNYAFPFEPHFAIPLLPIFPKLTRFFLPKKISESGLWKSLNFISYRQVRSFSRKSNLFMAVEKGTMLASLIRLQSDTEFASRQKALKRIVDNPFLFAVLRRSLTLPMSLATPMNFVLAHASPDLNWSERHWRIKPPKNVSAAD